PFYCPVELRFCVRPHSDIGVQFRPIFALIPYIAEVLEIPEQFLFDDSSRARKIFLKHILKDISNEEKELLKSKICPEQNQKINIAKDRFHTINDLLVYAPEIFLENLENTLKNYKDLTLKFTK
ncbi:hypothetical protein, partial [Aliarcobacter cryaerophilus]|uniref:hypothetical protein n=1 Tax=Aliarcobacter cryaerophilus TaxID=28198 RepID=UPI0021B51197